MKADKKDIFKKIIKLGDHEQPLVNFTDTVMKTIEVEVQRETALKALLQQQPAEGPSFSFTANVMTQISAKPQAVSYKPIITKKAWYTITSVALLFLSLIGLSNSSKGIPTDQDRLALLMKTVNAIPQFYLIGIIIVSCLLFADYLITQRKAKIRPDMA